MYSQTQTQAQPHDVATLEIVRQQLAHLPAAHRAAFYERSLVQNGAIRISQDGTFSILEEQLAILWQLTIPTTHPEDTIATESAQVFYSRNEFAVPIAAIPSFAAWRVGGAFKPSDLITGLVVQYGPPTAPGGGNDELMPLLSMPRLSSVRLVFQDYEVKGLGPSSYLRPSAWAIMELKKRMAVTLQLRVNESRKPTNEEGVVIRDITRFLDAPTREDEAMVEASRRTVEGYRGPSPNVRSILMQCGWSWEDSEKVMELTNRVLIRDWVEEQRLEMLASRDVEMT